MNLCSFCGMTVDSGQPHTWKEVRGWVRGPKKDSMTLREDTGRYAHEFCINKAREGQSSDQPELFDDDATAGDSASSSSDNLQVLEQLIADRVPDSRTKE